MHSCGSKSMMVTANGMLEKSIAEVVHLIRSGSLSSSDLLKICHQRIKKIKPLNAFISVSSQNKMLEALQTNRPGKLKGIPFSVKDNFSTKNISTTCGSMMLKDYVPTYDATVVDKLKANGGSMMGKTNMDEFAMGSGSVHSLFGPTRNPWKYDLKQKDFADWHIAGGSSGGSAVAVAAGASYFALGSDTGGSVRIPASFCGIVGLKPTYGALSRHGLISLVNSLDAPGIFTRTIDDAAYVFNILSGHDAKDSTTTQAEINHVTLQDQETVDGLVIGIPKEYHAPNLSPEILNAWKDAADTFSNAGAVVKEVSMPHTQYSIMCYHVLGSCEVASNFARYDGLEYGHRATGRFTEELYARSRNEGFNETVRARIMAGNFFLLNENYKTYYDKALRVRRLISNDFQDVFNQGIDVLLTPVTIGTAPRYNEFLKKSNNFQSKLHDIYTQASNLAGVPAISVPIRLSESKLPIGLQLMANHFREDSLLKAAKFLENNYNFPYLSLELE